MRADLYVSHATLYVSDADETLPVNHWREAHAKQGFARRASTMNMLALFDEDGFIRRIESTADALDGCEKIFAFSLHCPSGRAILRAGDATGETIWAGRPGWARLTVGQQLLSDAESPDLRVAVFGEEAASEQPSRIWAGGKEVLGPFVEVAEPLSYWGPGPPPPPRRQGR